jgi:hypothetical protein
MGDKDVLITEHRYTQKYDKSILSGKYCVQFMTFKNTENGMKVLNWWADACIDWCYNRHEEGKFGDQKYLDDWTTRFSGIHELQHLGGGVAPWNIQQYEFEQEKGTIFGTELVTNTKFELVFYHFHYLSFYEKQIDLGSYVLTTSDKKIVYNTYLKEMSYTHQTLAKHSLYLTNHLATQKKSYLRQIIHSVIRKLNGINNYIKY